MARLRYNGLSGTLGAAHNDSTTTLTLASKLTSVEGDVPTLAGDDYFALSILDSNGLCAEIVHVTAYTTGATSATIVRGAEGTAGAAHDNGATFVNGPTALDVSGRILVDSASFTAQNTVTIDLPSGYEGGFELVVIARSSDSGGDIDGLAARFQVGGVTQTSGYSWKKFDSNSTSASASDAELDLVIPLANAASGADDRSFGVIRILPGYDDSGEYTHLQAWGTAVGNSTTENLPRIMGGSYRSTATVDGIVIAPNDNGFGSDTITGKYRLYGLA